LKKEDRKDEVTKVNEEKRRRSSEEEVIRRRIRHLITCLLFPVILSSTSLPVFLPSPSSLLTLPHCLFPYFFSILFLITFSVYWKEYKEKDREDGGRMVKR
jgi:hypothetical protein